MMVKQGQLSTTYSPKSSNMHDKLLGFVEKIYDTDHRLLWKQLCAQQNTHGTKRCCIISLLNDVTRKIQILSKKKLSSVVQFFVIAAISSELQNWFPSILEVYHHRFCLFPTFIWRWKWWKVVVFADSSLRSSRVVAVERILYSNWRITLSLQHIHHILHYQVAKHRCIGDTQASG